MWQPIETAPKHGYIVVGTKDGKWYFNTVWWNEQVEEWEDVSSDRYVRPSVWAPLPEDHPSRGPMTPASN
jgi:hypothetical protein